MFEQPELLVTLVFVIGLIVGSFLNVVIYRLPIMMHASWRKECLDFIRLSTEINAELKWADSEMLKTDELFNLVFPSSRCPNCNKSVRFYQNIPVLSYLFLKGKCAYCKARIPARYPLIEIFTAVMSAVVAWHFGYTIETVFALCLTWSLIALSFIDIDCQLLPDSITLPLLWLGLCLSLFGYFTDTRSSIIGAIAGYGVLWAIYHLFKLITGKEGMGYGDFKLLSLFGAWFGWQCLPMIILLSSLVGTIIGIAMIVIAKRDHTIPIPYGPYLAMAGWLALLWGHDFNQFYLANSGL